MSCGESSAGGHRRHACVSTKKSGMGIALWLNRYACADTAFFLWRTVLRVLTSHKRFKIPQTNATNHCSMRNNVCQPFKFGDTHQNFAKPPRRRHKTPGLKPQGQSVVQKQRSQSPSGCENALPGLALAVSSACTGSSWLNLHDRRANSLFCRPFFRFVGHKFKFVALRLKSVGHKFYFVGL